MENRLYLIAYFIIYSIFALGSGNDHNLIKEADKYIGIKEATGNNDGEPYELFMKPYGYGIVPWCALFIKKVGDDATAITDHINATAISCVSKNTTRDRRVGLVWWKPRSGGTGHVGYIKEWPAYSDKFLSVEGNYSNKVAEVWRSKDIAKRAAFLKFEDISDHEYTNYSDTTNLQLEFKGDTEGDTEESQKTMNSKIRITVISTFITVIILSLINKKVNGKT